MARARKAAADPNAEAFAAAWNALRAHPMFAPMTSVRTPSNTWHGVAAKLLDQDSGLAEVRTVAFVDQHGNIRAARWQRLSVAEWTWVLAHCLLHLGFGHLAAGPAPDEAARAAACVAVARFQRAVKLGTEPLDLPAELPTPDEEVLARQWRDRGVPDAYRHCGVGGAATDINVRADCAANAVPDWPAAFAVGLAAAATAAIDVAGGARTSLTDPAPRRSVWDQAKTWFVSSFPLLGGLASGFEVIRDVQLARSWDISIAAVSADAGEIYINPQAGLSLDEWKFVFAHEMLHAALRHGDRVGPRDAYLWNVACDYVINGWLVEMAVGQIPEGLLYDSELGGLSAEAIYDRIVTDVRRIRKLATLRGRGLGDVLGEPIPWTGRPGSGVDLDEFYRRALLTGYAHHVDGNRGLLPAGLVEEIRVLEHPPLPWDARLARWFDEFVPSPTRVRSFARPSRRQASTPTIPRPGWRYPDEEVERCTFGVVLDTSGSMDPRLLGKALGAIASYASARDVPAARVVFCDAVAYDIGFVAPADIAGRVRVHGRGGTVLQPGIDLLERAADLPRDAPILVITDGECDVIRVRREHAFLIPDGAGLPFTPRGPVFRVR